MENAGTVFALIQIKASKQAHKHANKQKGYECDAGQKKLYSNEFTQISLDRKFSSDTFFDNINEIHPFMKWF